MRDQEIYARELAVAIAEGLSLEEAARETNIELATARGLTDHPEFEASLRKVNEWDSWQALLLETSGASSMRQKAQKNAQTYFDIMDGIAKNVDARPETRFQAAKDLLKLAGFFREEAQEAEVVQMPQRLIENLARATKEMDA
jgi:hypothetical protein